MNLKNNKKYYEKPKHGGDIYSEKYENGVLDFSANINPLGMPDSVKKALIANIDNYEAYPDSACTELKKALSYHFSLPIKHIVCGNGAADLIYRLVLSLKPEKALILSPTFSEYESALRVLDCEIRHFYLRESQGFIPCEEILEEITDELDIIFICNPNNPTGIPIKKDLILRIGERCKKNHVFLVVDECFSDFLEDEDSFSIKNHITELHNTVILKAFTKLYAMAGIRLGYAFTSDETIGQLIENAMQPWSVSTVASVCGISALKENFYKEKTIKVITENRKILEAELKRLGLKLYDSKANYIFFKSGDLELEEKLKKRGILIRSCENFRGLSKEYYRIAVRKTEENGRLVKNLEEILCQKP